MFDLLIRNGSVVDGAGGDPRSADVAVQGDRIVAVEPGLGGEAHEVIDAEGLTVTPGFIDIHTHYDGQVFWDSGLELSAGHGVTTVVTGNCGVGLAPVYPGGEDSLIEMMEGVEDIPFKSLKAGVPFGWETYSDFMDDLEQRRWAVDVATMVAHGPVREYVMREAGANGVPASPDEVDEIAKVVRGAIEAGAFGMSSNRVEGHATRGGRPVAGTYATYAELRAIAEAVVAGGGHLLEVAQAALAERATQVSVVHELPILGRLSRDVGLPLTFLTLQERGPATTMWRRQLELAAAENDSGARLIPQIAGRPFGVLVGFPVNNPFLLRPTFQALSQVPIEEKLQQLQRPEIRRAILSEKDDPALGAATGVIRTKRIVDSIIDNLHHIFPLGEEIDYEPPPERSIVALAESTGKDPLEVIYDLCLEDRGRALLLFPSLNYSDGDHAALYEQLQWPGTLLGLDDAGAHSTMICDASQPTTMLTHWIRDRSRGPRITVGLAVKKMTSEPAEAIGLRDRGVIAVGKRADLNVINLTTLRLHMPYVTDDLPEGGRRLLQAASGYEATVVGGTITRRKDKPTGALPGRLLRRSA